MTCTCSPPNQSCKHAKPKVNGYYCTTILPKTEPKQIGELRAGQRFSFEQTPYNTHTVKANFGDYVVYERPCGWIIQERDLTRIVNLII